MPPLERHLFVCVNERACNSPKGCCFSKGGKEVRDAFKKALAGAKLKGIVRANNAGCLDVCESGVAVVVYPEQVWYGGVTVSDVSEIVEKHIIGGQFVQRLMLPEQGHLGRELSGPPLRIPEQVAKASET